MKHAVRIQAVVAVTLIALNLFCSKSSFASGSSTTPSISVTPLSAPVLKGEVTSKIVSFIGYPGLINPNNLYLKITQTEETFEYGFGSYTNTNSSTIDPSNYSISNQATPIHATTDIHPTSDIEGITTNMVSVYNGDYNGIASYITSAFPGTVSLSNPDQETADQFFTRMEALIPAFKGKLSGNVNYADISKYESALPTSFPTNTYSWLPLTKASLNYIKLQYQWQVNAVTNDVVTWDEQFQQDSYKDGSGNLVTPPVLHKLISWVNTSGTNTNSSVYTIDPIHYTNADGSLQTNNGWWSVNGMQVQLAVDANRDGTVDFGGSDRTSQNNPYRFWVNPQTTGVGVIQSQQMTQNDGLMNLENLSRLGLSIDGGTWNLVNQGKLKIGLKWKTPTGTPALFIYPSADPSGTLSYLTNSQAASNQISQNGNSTIGAVFGNTPLVLPISSLPSNGGSVTFLFEATGIGKGSLEVVFLDQNEHQIAEGPCVWVNLSNISDMYRTANLRGATAGSTDVSDTSANPPPNNPDTNSNGKMVVFVHGFNVNENGAVDWFNEAFKRLYWSGSKAMFTGVLWNGNANGVDYWQNVENAFNTAQVFNSTVNSLPGSSKTVIAHSLGNMVVSAAINDNGLSPANYFMLDAAMPMEAFDPSQFNQGVNTNMVNAAYNGYTNTLWASYWNGLFQAPDNRAKLTWVNRFPNVTAVNFYSSGEEVLANGVTGDVTSGVMSTLITLGSHAPFAWFIQEETKGTSDGKTLMSITSFNAIFNESAQGGWGISTNYGQVIDQGEGDTFIPIPPSQANQMIATNSAMFQTNPFFTPFADTNLTGQYGNAEASIPSVRATVLAKAIPALSYAVGGNQITNSSANINVNYDLVLLEDGWPQDRPIMPDSIHRRWFHSDAKDVAYPFTHKLWDLFVISGNLK